MTREQGLSDFVEKFMTLPSDKVSYSEGFHIMNKFCQNKCSNKYHSLNAIYCKMLILEIIPEIIADKYSHIATDEKLKMFWEVLSYVNRVSGISYEQFVYACRKRILKQFTNKTIVSSILRRQIIGR